VALKEASLYANSHLSLLQPGGDGPPLFCLADLLGQPFNYLSLARELAPDRTIYGLAPGPLKSAFAADGDINRLIEALTVEVRRIRPVGPYLIAGYSAGGLLAAALAGELEREGLAVQLVLLDSALHSRLPQGGHIARWMFKQARGMFDPRGLGRQIAGLLSLLGRALGRSASAAPSDWVPGAQIAFARQLMTLGATYRPAPFNGPTLMVVADDRNPLDTLFDADGLSGWAGVLTGPVTRANAPGGHYQFMREPNVAATAAAIRSFLTSNDAGEGAPEPEVKVG
jgi:thioesterase domain-containing protein